MVDTRKLLMSFALAAVAAGCSDSGTEPTSSDLTADDAEVLASFLVDDDVAARWSAESAEELRTGSHEFSRVVDCPAGGSRGVTGEGNSTFDPSTRILETNWTTTHFHDECAFVHPRRRVDVLVVIDGSITATGNASYQLPEQRGTGKEVLSYDVTRVGSTTTTIGDRTRTCEVDVTEHFDPETKAFHVTGTICGRVVDIVRGGGRDT